MSTVLLVEDEMLIRELAAEDLTDAGFDVVVLANGDEAWTAVEAGIPFDLLLTDISMPGVIDGVELGSRVRARRPDVPVVYATGRDDQGLALGHCERVVVKPYMVEHLVRVMADLGVTPN